MAETNEKKIIIYENGGTREIDPKDIYEPFPEKGTDEKGKKDGHGI